MTCVICDTVLDVEYGNPMGGVLFSAAGNYGSGVFDSMLPPPELHQGESMELCLCDKCLLAKRGSITIAATKTTIERRPW